MPFEFSRLRGVRTITMLQSWVVPYSFIVAVGYYGFSLEHCKPIGLRAVSPNGRRVVGSVGYSEDYLVIDVASGKVTHRIEKPGRWEWWSDDEIFTLRSDLGDNAQSRQTFSLAKAMAAMAIVAPLFTVWGSVFPYI